MAAEGVIEIVDLENDLYTPISCRGLHKHDAISVENYSSSIKSINRKRIINLDDYDDGDDEVIVIASRRYEQGQSSNSKSYKPYTFECVICAETKRRFEFFNIKGCKHCYCKECMSRYVASKIQENVIVIKCPESNCSGVLELEFCREILPREVFDRWGNALCESLILGAEKFYCPFKDCSALLIDDGGVTVKESECPHCRRMFCAQCKVPWHMGIVCEEFQKLGKGEREREDIMLMKLAKDKSWQRCPKCKIYVERIEGCLFMKCRCGHTFCYNCAAPMKPSNHNCTKCRR
ncbi:RBR-type E3 ubiquitin transferase [Ranunculus cassubicifolius]